MKIVFNQAGPALLALLVACSPGAAATYAMDMGGPPDSQDGPPALPPRPRHSQSLALSVDGARLAVVNPDADSLSVIDTRARRLLREIPLAASGAAPRPDAEGRYEPALGPRAVALSDDGRRAYVACQWGGVVLTVDTESGAVLARLPVGAEPVAALLHPRGDALYVAVYQSAEVLRVPLRDGVLQAAAVQRQRLRTSQSDDAVDNRPFGLALDGAGATLYATRFLLQPGVALFDAATLAPRGDVPLADVPATGNPLHAHGVPRGLYQAAVRPGDQQVVVAHQLLAVDTPQPRLDFETTVFPALSVLDAKGQRTATLSVNARMLPGAALGDVVSAPRALDFTPDGALLLALNLSSEDVLVIDSERQVQIDLVRPLPGDLPEGLVIAPDGRSVYVDQRASNDVAVLTIAADWRSRGGGKVQVDGPPIPRLADKDPMPAELRLGQRLFYSANSAELPLTQNFWVSCASCHIEGRSDGVTWLFTQGPRDTPSNAGGTRGTGFLLRTAGRNTVTQYDETIRIEQGGDVDDRRPQDHALLLALTAYVDRAIPLPRSPERDVVTGALSAAAQRGQGVFRRLGCDACHSGPRYTDSGTGNPTLALSGPLQLHDVGTCNKGQTPDRAAPAYDGSPREACLFDTPSLNGVLDSAPYFHDGSAATLGAVVDHFIQRFRYQPAPTTSERDDLIAFLRSL